MRLLATVGQHNGKRAGCFEEEASKEPSETVCSLIVHEESWQSARDV